MRVAQHLSKKRASCCSVDNYNDYMDKLEAKLKELGIMDKPWCIYNCDESGFICSHGTKKVLCKRGCNNPHRIVNDNEKAMYTVMVSLAL
jgi:hypothetical protein